MIRMYNIIETADGNISAVLFCQGGNKMNFFKDIEKLFDTIFVTLFKAEY